MEWLSSWGGWLIGGFFLLILEVIVPGVFVMWWGISAIIMAGIIVFFPTLALAWQMVIFAIISTIFSITWWKYQHSKDQKEDISTELNARNHAMIGVQGNIVEILENGIARGKFGDTTWRVVGEQLKIGDIVEVVNVKGITLSVKSLSL